jgi:hypothetical protein
VQEEEEAPPTSPHSSHRIKERSGAVAARASHLLAARGRRSGVARGRSEPPVVVSDLLLRELQMLANHECLNIKKHQHASEAYKVI